MLEIPGRKAAFAGIVAQLDFAAFERLPVGRADDRQQHAAAGAIGQLVPVDVEGRRMRRSRTPFQHVQPPRIVGKVDADMVGYEIEDQPDIVLLQRRTEPFETGLAAELWIELVVIDDVVAMGRALARLHERRSIEMRNAEGFQIGHHGGGGIEIEIRRQLQTVGRDRDRRRHGPIRGARPPTTGGRPRSTRCPRSGFPSMRAAHGRYHGPTGWL